MVSLAIEGAPASQGNGGGARTLYPDLDGFTKYELLFTATSEGLTHGPVEVTSSGTSAPLDLVVGTYDVTATAYTGGGPYTAVAVGEKTGLVITREELTTESIILGPKTGGADGAFDYDITVPQGTSSAQLVITTAAGGTVSNGTVTLTPGTQNTGTVNLAPGQYNVLISLAKGGDTAGGREVIHVYTGMTSSWTREYDDDDFSAPLTQVSLFDLSGAFAAPAQGQTPAVAITATAEYSGTITWTPSHTTFAAATPYTAIVNLSPAQGYTFIGVLANSFSYSGAAVTNSQHSGLVTISFTVPVSSFDLSGTFATPVAGEVPETAISATAQYTGTIAWSPAPGAAFAPATAYTATLSLSPQPGYTFAGVPGSSFTYTGATVTHAANSGTVAIAFGQTGAFYGVAGVGLGFNYGGIAISKDPPSGIIEQGGDTLTLSVPSGYTDVAWYLDGAAGPAGTGDSIILDADDYTIKTHSITVTWKEGGILYAQGDSFTVNEQVAGVEAAGLAAFLATLPQGTAANPSVVRFSSTLDVTSNDWGTTVKNALAASTKYVVLDLSKCTATGNTISGNELSQTGNDFNVIKTDYIVGIVLPKTLTEIGNYALTSFTALTSVTIPNGVERIGDGAFMDVPLVNVSIPNTVKELAFNSFRRTNLTSVVIPASVEKIGRQAFSFTSLVTVTFEGNDAVIERTNSFDTAGTTQLKNVYDAQTTKAGTYSRASGSWIKLP
jgi:hypothetical protein